MKYQRFGKTEMQVSHLGLGAIKFGSLSQEEATNLIQTAHEGGINYIDTARGYGDSEIRVGTALKELGLREQFILSSKVIRRGLTEFQEDIETTFRNLQTEYLDILFLHDVSTAPNWNRLQKRACSPISRSSRHLAVSVIWAFPPMIVRSEKRSSVPVCSKSRCWRIIPRTARWKIRSSPSVSPWIWASSS